jgi:hypothetical protein
MRSFWPTIAHFGVGYNLLVLAKVGEGRAAELEKEFSGAWTTEGMADLYAAGLLYEIDMGILDSVKTSKALDGSVRFAPATVTVAEAGSRVEGAHADRHQGVGARPAGARVHRTPRRRMALRAPGGEDVDHGLGHMAGPRLPLAHRHGPRCR